MGSILLALSVHHYISSVGADCGFAALVGLAILVVLYFAQARETSSLRDQVAESSQRVQELETRLAHPGQTGPAAASVPGSAPTIVPQPSGQTQVPGAATAAGKAPATAIAPAAASGPAIAGAPAIATAAAGAGAPGGRAAATSSRAQANQAHTPGPVKQLQPAAPAGVAAPALAAATRLIPAPMAAAGAGAVQPGGTAVADAPIEDTAFVSPAAAAAARGSNGLAAAGAGNHGGTQKVTPAPAPRVPIRPSGGAYPAARGEGRARVGAPAGGSRRLPKALIVLVSGLLVAGVVAALVILTSGTGSSSSTVTHKTATNMSAAHHKARAVAFNPRSVKLAVLNGTATAGLASRIATKLEGHGYSVGTTTNAVNQTTTTSVVAYTPGQRTAALEVAQSLGLRSATVQPISTSTQDVACPPPSPCANTVVVTAGADLASST